MDVVQTQRNIARRTRSSPEERLIHSRRIRTRSASPRMTEEGSQMPTPPSAESLNTYGSITSINEGDGIFTPDAANGAIPGAPRKFRRRTATATTTLRSASAPRPRRHPLLEDHYRVDQETRAVLPGVPKHDPDWPRDSHDFWNLIVLLPINTLNAMNWNWDLIIHSGLSRPAACWTGDHFDLFFKATFAYFAIDLLWILLVPEAVKSPATIIQHHVATMLYILIPYHFAQYQWCMGACMSVELNTWFLIARRVFNKQGFPPWIIDLSIVSIRVKIISILFYVTWIAIRCILYPALMSPFVNMWLEHSRVVGTGWNLVFLCVPLHACFCLLNLKWTYDLIRSKWRYWNRYKKNVHYVEHDKGL